MKQLPTCRLLLATIVVCVGVNIPYAYYCVYPNTAIGIFQRFLNEPHNGSLSPQEFSGMWSLAISNTTYIGALVGAVIMFLIVDCVGRKGTIMLGLLPLLVGGGIELLAFYWLKYLLFCFGQFVIGISMGMGSSVAGVYLTECAPVSFRGFVATFQELTLDFLYGFSMCVGLPDVAGVYDNRYLLVGIPLVAVVVVFVIVTFIPESPRQLLITKHDEAGAIKSIKFFQGEQFKVEDVIEQIQEEERLASGMSYRSLIRELFTTYKMNFAIGTASVLLVPFSGVVGIAQYSTIIFAHAGFQTKVAEYTSLCLGILNFVVTLSALPLIERVGRRPLLLTSCGGVIVTFLVFVISTLIYQSYNYLSASYVSVAAILGHMIFLSIGIGPIPWFYTSELLPYAHRAIAYAIISCACLIFILITTAVVLPLFYSIGAYCFLILYIGPLIVLFGFLFWKMPETKQKTITEIVLELRGTTPYSDNTVNLKLLNNGEPIVQQEQE